MRYRTTLFFLLACLLAAYPALQANPQQALCATVVTTENSGNLLSLLSGESSGCPSDASQTGRVLLVLAGLCAVAGFISAAKGWRDRQRDNALLNGAQPPV